MTASLRATDDSPSKRLHEPDCTNWLREPDCANWLRELRLREGVPAVEA
jgi:hypothetical protein